MEADATDRATPRSLRAADGAREVKKARRVLIVYRVEGLRSGGEARMAALRSPLVGRARELNQLNGLLDETLETATPHFALVYGPAGIGKSRLIVEFLAAARARSEAQRAHRPVPSDRSRDHMLGPRGILRQAFGIALDDPADVAAEKVLHGARAAPAGPSCLSRARANRIRARNDGRHSAAGRPLSELEPRLVVDELARAWPCFATALARRRPTIVVVEDLPLGG